MASLKFFNTSTNQWEAIKTDAINGVIPNNQTYVATQGQTTFTIPNGTIADPKLISVFVDGKARTDFTMPNNTTIQFLSGINSGLQVYAQWFEVSVPATTGHHQTHEKNGNDAIDVTKLTNYQEQIATPLSTAQTNITNLQTDVTNHKNNTSNPHNVTSSQVGAYSKTEADTKFVDASGDTINGNLTLNGDLTANHILIVPGNLSLGADPNGGAAIVSNRLVLSLNGAQWFEFLNGLGANVITSGQVRLVMHTTDPTFRMERSDGGGATLVVQTVTQTSDINKKKNIIDYDKSALEEINTTTVKYYNFTDEVDNVDLPHVGIIMQESPIDVVDMRGNGVDTYAMVSMAWKAIQELSAKVTSLENDNAQLKTQMDEVLTRLHVLDNN